MTRPTLRHRGRALASLTAVAGLCLSGTAVSSGPAVSAEATGDCAVAFPVDELAAGAPVTGLTVTRGTAPSGFTGEVLGVLDDGIGPGLDMVMVRLSTTASVPASTW